MTWRSEDHRGDVGAVHPTWCTTCHSNTPMACDACCEPTCGQCLTEHGDDPRGLVCPWCFRSPTPSVATPEEAAVPDPVEMQVWDDDSQADGEKAA